MGRVDETSPKRTRAQWKPSDNSVLCSKHFADDCFEPGPDIAAQLGMKMARRPQFLSGKDQLQQSWSLMVLHLQVMEEGKEQHLRRGKNHW